MDGNKYIFFFGALILGDIQVLRNTVRGGVCQLSLKKVLRRCTVQWNNLSTDCVHASSVNMFKNKTDKYFVKAGYT